MSADSSEGWWAVARRLLPSACTFVLGGLLYLLRPTAPAVVELLGGARVWSHLSPSLAVVREACPTPVLHHGSDALFAMSVGLFFVALWGIDLWALCGGLALVIGLELAQLLAFVPGTFDVLDVVAMALAYPLALAWYLRRESQASSSLGTKAGESGGCSAERASRSLA